METYKNKDPYGLTSGVTKTVMGICPLLRANAPTLACSEHKEDFNGIIEN